MLAGPRFDLTETLEGVLAEPRFDAPAESWWDRFLERAVAEFVRLLAAVIEAVGGPVTAAFIALAIVGVVTLFVAFRLAGRRAAIVEDRIVLERLLAAGADPDAFLRRAADASQAGDHAGAVRLRFVGGVLDLSRRGRITYSPGLTTEAIAQQVDDPVFAQLADQFDRVAYGGFEPGAAGDSGSQRLWEQMRRPA